MKLIFTIKINLKKIKVAALFSFSSSDKVKVESMEAGDIGIIAGFDSINIGDSLTAKETEVALPRIEVDEPTVAVMLSVNDGPLCWT